MVCKKENEGQLAPMLVVAASPDGSGGGMGGGGLGLCLLDKMPTGPGMVHCNSIEKLIY